MQTKHRVSIRSQFLLLTFLSGLCFGAMPAANADTIEKVRGKQAIVIFEDSEAQVSPGDKFFAMEGGKKKALLEVVKFKAGKAVVKIVKGKATEGMEIMASKPAGDEADQASGDEAAEEGQTSKKKKSRNAGSATLFKDMTIGLVGGYVMDTQNVLVSSTTMTGNGFAAKVFTDIPVTDSLGLYARAGAEQFNVQGGVHKTEILYGTLDLMLKYAFSSSGIVPFVMGGLSLHFPLSKSSTILDVNLISSTTVFGGGGGVNFAIGGSTYFQLTAEYGMFPPSSQVTTSLIAAYAGLGFRF